MDESQTHFNYFGADPPVFATRAVHLDLKGLPPTFDRLMQWLDLFAKLHINALLVEWEDTFPWSVDDHFRGRTVYRREQVCAFADKANALGIELIPLVQCLGHLEFVLAWPRYQAMRELPDRDDCINPLHEGSGPLIRSLILDVLDVLPRTRRMHLGGDEAWAFASNDQTRAFAAEHGEAALFLHHVQPLMDLLDQRGIRPLLWHDMTVNWTDEQLSRLGDRTDLVVWDYHGQPTAGTHPKHELLQRFAGLDLPIWAGAAFKGAESDHAILPDPAARSTNLKGWADAAARWSMRGCVATGWSRYSTNRPQVEPLDASLDSLCACCVLMYAGRLPNDDIAGCLNLLTDAERQRFNDVYEPLAELQRLLKMAWMHALLLEHCRAGLCVDATRRRDAVQQDQMELLNKLADQIRDAARLAVGPLSAGMDVYWAQCFVQTHVHAVDAITQHIQRVMFND